MASYITRQCDFIQYMIWQRKRHSNNIKTMYAITLIIILTNYITISKFQTVPYMAQEKHKRFGRKRKRKLYIFYGPFINEQSVAVRLHFFASFTDLGE